MITIQKFDHTGREWAQTEQGIATGTAWLGEMRLDAREILQNCCAAYQEGGRKVLQKLISQLNGFFAVGARFDNKTGFVAGDVVRSIPLFYGQQKPHAPIVITNEPEDLRDAWGAVAIDRVVEAEYRLTGYVTGDETLDPRLFQNRAGFLTILHLGGAGELQKTHYETTPFLPLQSTQRDEPTLTAELEEAWDHSITRLIEFAAGRQIVVPLSGGYDSRLIVMSLVEAGYENLQTFTYGREGAPELGVSKTIAETLGVAWAYAPYTLEGWQAWANRPDKNKLFRIGRKSVSSPHIQDGLAIQHLLDTGVIEKDALIVPGHSGDFVAGSHMPKTYLTEKAATGTVERRTFLAQFWLKHYNLWEKHHFSKEMISAIEQRILENCGFEKPSEYDAIALHDRWDLQERQAKFIVNSIRAYEHHSLDWWLPMYDLSFVDFFRRLPTAHRLNQEFYNRFVTVKFANFAKVTRDESAKTDRDRPMMKLRRMIEAVPGMRPLARAAYDQVKRRQEYRRHPLLWYGTVPEAEFKKHYTGRQNINSFISRQALEDFKAQK